jgi:hypothetical protein
MGRARGANSHLYGKFETAYGTPPGGNYLQLPFVSCNLGVAQGLIESDLLGQGRESYDPTLDVVNNDGDVTVPVDAGNFGDWLNLLLGPATTVAQGSASGDIVFSAQPAVNATITINGTVFTFVASGATGPQINIGAGLTDTLDNAVTVLNASVVTGVALATYSKVGTTKLHIAFDAAGVAGNAFTLAASVTPVSNGVVSGAVLTGGTNKHTFTSGAQNLPAMSLETAKPDVPSYEMNYGVRANTMKIDMKRSGLLNAVMSLIAKGALAMSGTSGAGTPTTLAVSRFAQATGQITQDGVQLGSVVAASVAYSNSLDKVETIAPNGEIEDADPGMAMASGNATIKFKDQVLIDKATGRTPVALTFGWTFGAFSLLFTFQRVLLPRPKVPITGPAGIQASFDWQGSGAAGPVMTVDLVNDVTGYTAAAI